MGLIALAGCGGVTVRTPSCDPRVLEPGEVRARQVLCSDELIPDGDGRVGDWILENAAARFTLRGTYGALYALDEAGGTLVDAVAVRPDGTTTPDVLGELRPDGDRSAIAAENGEGEAALVLPGMRWTLGADDGALRLEGPDGGPIDAVVQPLPGAVRSGATWAAEGFFGTDGAAPEGDLPVVTLPVSRVAAERTAWTTAVYGAAEPVAGATDAEAVRVELDGALITRLPVDDGVVVGVAPPGATLRGERAGCDYSGLVAAACGAMAVRVRDDAGLDLPAAVKAGATRIVLPRGGGQVRAGTDAFHAEVGAGPAYALAALDYRPGGQAALTLRREMDTDGAVLADLRRAVAPDPDVAWASDAAAHDAAADGVSFVVVYADDEVPTAAVDPDDRHTPGPGGADALMVRAGVRSRASDGGTVLSWPWTPNGKRPAHGAPPAGLDALDLLTVARDNSDNRRTVVDADWARAALAASPVYAWYDTPLAIWLDGPQDLDAYLALLDAWVPVTPVGPSTWIELPTGDANVPGIEAGLYAGQSTAGTGARIEVRGGFAGGGEQRVWELRVHAPRRMDIETVDVWTPDGRTPYALEPMAEGYGGGTVRVRLPADTPWAVAVAQGADGSWAVRGF